MYILLDNIVFSLQSTGGISVYWSELIKGLLNCHEQVCFVERLNARQNLQRRELDLSGEVLITDRRLPLQVSRYTSISTAKKTDMVYHSSYYRPIARRDVPTVVTVHDFTYERCRKGLPRLLHLWQKQRALQQATIIICVSHHTRKDLFAFYPQIEQWRVRVVPQAASKCYHPLDDLQDRPSDSVLFVGDRKYYKNFTMAVEAVANLPDKLLTIVGGGTLSLEENSLLKKLLPGRHLHKQGVSAAELNLMYNQAYCLLYPSGYEGFGIPPLEAMQAGCPVVASKTSSLPEVCGNAAMLAENPNVSDFVTLMKQLEDKNTRKLLRNNGFRQATQFTWDRTCRETLSCYREALSSKSSL